MRLLFKILPDICYILFTLPRGYCGQTNHIPSSFTFLFIPNCYILVEQFMLFLFNVLPDFFYMLFTLSRGFRPDKIMLLSSFTFLFITYFQNLMTNYYWFLFGIFFACVLVNIVYSVLRIFCWEQIIYFLPLHFFSIIIFGFQFMLFYFSFYLISAPDFIRIISMIYWYSMHVMHIIPDSVIVPLFVNPKEWCLMNWQLWHGTNTNTNTNNNLTKRQASRQQQKFKSDS